MFFCGFKVFSCGLLVFKVFLSGLDHVFVLNGVFFFLEDCELLVICCTFGNFGLPKSCFLLGAKPYLTICFSSLLVGKDNFTI